MQAIKNYIINHLEGFEYVGDLYKEGYYYYFTISIQAGKKGIIKEALNPYVKIECVDYDIICAIKCKIEAGLLKMLVKQHLEKNK